MKKFVVLLVVVAMTCISAVAFAADVTVGGSTEIRSRNFDNLDFTDNANDAASQTITQQRTRINVNAKAGDVKGKISLESGSAGWDTWGNRTVAFDNKTTVGTSSFGLREGWISFPLPGTPVTVTGGHQLLQLGNGWFFRSQNQGSDAWVASTKLGDTTLAFVNVKYAEGTTNVNDDIDAYAVIAAFKVGDMAIGADVTRLNNRRASGLTPAAPAGSTLELNNIGLNFAGKVGPVGLKAQVDLQKGDLDTPAGSTDIDANEVVVQASIPVGAITINALLGMGSGQDNSNDITAFQTTLDKNPNYTFIYEYLVAGASGSTNTAFSNTTVIGVGASMKASSSVTVAADVYMLQATEKVACAAGTCTGETDDMGTEIDVKVNWKVADNLNWNWVLGMLKPGDGMGKDDATAIQGVLNFSF